MSLAELERRAELVRAATRDLEHRLEALHKAPVYQKLAESRFVVAALFELLHAQSEVNAGVLAALRASERFLRARL